MITATLALALVQAGLQWRPRPGDRFTVRASEMGEEVFHLADMAVEAHDLDTGIILAFNGTTEWALDSVAVENTVWLPREDQLRDALGEHFVSLTRDRGLHTVRFTVAGATGEVTDADVEAAYARAVLRVLRARRPGEHG